MSSRRLWLAFLGAPTAWAIHLAVSYFFVAIECGTGWRGAEPAVLAATAVCAAAAVWAGWLGWRATHTQRPSGGLVLDPPGASGFLAVGGVVLAILFFGAIILTGIAPLFLPICS